MNFNSPVAAFCAAVSAAIGSVLPPINASAATPTETLVVSAARIPIPIAAFGGSVSIVDRAEIERRQQIFAAELLTLTPGISVSRSGGYGSQTQLRMRGAEANQVLVLIDGVEANDPAGNDEFAIEHLTTFDIERIEIVRGPQSALWGSDALAGVINIITRPAADSLGGEVLAEAGAFDTIRGGMRLDGTLGPVRSAFSVSRVDSDGTNVSESGSEDDGYENTTASLNLAADAAENLSLSLTGRITDATKATDLTSFVTGVPEDSDELPESDIVLGFVGAGANLDLFEGRWSHELHTTWSSSDTDYSEVIDTTSGARAQVSAVAADKYDVQYQTTWRPGGTDDPAGTALTLAVDQEWQKFSQRGIASPFGNPNQDQDMENLALIAELRLTPLDRVNLSFSGRSDDNSDFDNMNTFRATGSWELPNEVTRLRTSMGSGQKAPTFIERFGFYPDQFVGNPDLEPEESKGWEVGVDQQLLSGKLKVGITYFHEDLENEINGFVVSDPDCFTEPPFECTFTAENLDGKSRRRGVEVTADTTLSPSLILRANYTYVDSHQPDSADPPDPLNPDGEVREIRRPRHSASLNGAYTFMNDAMTVDVGVAYTGDRTDSYFGPVGTETVALDNYTLASAALTWRVMPELSLLARVENAFDTTYEDVYGYNTPGIGAFLGFRATMGR